MNDNKQGQNFLQWSYYGYAICKSPIKGMYVVFHFTSVLTIVYLE